MRLSPSAALLCAGLCFACGDSSTLTTPATPPPTTAPTVTPTPAPQATPFDCNRSDHPPGPVTSYMFKLKLLRRGDQVIEGPPEGAPFPTDAQGRVFVRVGDFLVFDSTQRNGSKQESQWTNDPQWVVDDPGGILQVREASRETTACGFLYRADAVGRGQFTITTSIDGVQGIAFFALTESLTFIVER